MKYWNDEMMKSLEWMRSNIPQFHHSRPFFSIWHSNWTGRL